MDRFSLRAVAALLLVTTAGCAEAQQLPAGVTAGPWKDLLAGGPAAHWRSYRADSFPSAWAFDPMTNAITRARRAGDIITREQFGDFDLEIEWKVTAGANSGIFYHATEETAVIYENAIEMQVLDNTTHPDGKNPRTSAGSNFALIAPASDVTKPVGEWNVARVVAVGPRVEHWLNGVKLLEYDRWTPEWTAMVKASKFNQWAPYGLARRGHIGLQEHGDVVSFRNIRIRELRR